VSTSEQTHRGGLGAEPTSRCQQAHLDRLTPLEAGFLAREDTSTVAHMHLGAVAVFDGPAPSGREFRGHVARRLPLLPRYRQRVAVAPYGAGRPLWVDDASFQIDYHVRHVALPGPGTEDQLRTLVSRVVSQRLDRSKPLWEMWLVEGLIGDRFAILSKVHHCLVDGIGGLDLLASLVDVGQESRAVPHDRWEAHSSPGTVGLVGRGLFDVARDSAGLLRHAAVMTTRPDKALLFAARGIGSALDLTRHLVDAAPGSPLNGALTPHRRVGVARTRLADHREIATALGGSLNDVVVAVVAGGLRTWLGKHGQALNPFGLRAFMPVSVRSADPSRALAVTGTEQSGLLAQLPVQVADTRERFEVGRNTANGLERGDQALGARLLNRAENLLPPVVLAQAGRLSFSSRTYNLLLGNVPGPQHPVYLLGRRMREIVPLAFLGPRQRLAVAAMSYDGDLNYGLIADRDTVPDLSDLALALEDAVGELLATARS
jgi:WS/DGAT/MGAT family acyltransferase